MRPFRALFLLLLVLPACAGSGGPQSTRLQTSDFELITSEMASDLRESDFLRGRTPDAPRWVVSIDKAVNLSSDLIPESERWYLVQKVRSSLPMLALQQDKNIAFVIPVEQWQAHLRGSSGEWPSADERAPTHQMSAVFRSVTRQAGLDRTDVYLVQYRILDIESGLEVWNGSYEFKRAARGRAWD